MLKFNCDESKKKTLTEAIISEFARADIKVDTSLAGSDFNITEEEDGLLLNGMKYCWIIKYGSVFRMEDHDGKAPGDALREIKKAFPDIEIKGSLLLGDDNYRRNYWYGSEAGSTDVVEDYAIVDIEDLDQGIPLSACWYSYEYGTDYGIEHLAFPEPADFAEILEEFCEDEELDLEELTECMQEEGCLPEDYDEAKKCLRRIVNKFVDEIEDYDDELNVEVLKTLRKICTKKEGKAALKEMIEELG